MQDRSEIRCWTALRGIACLLVLLFHFKFGYEALRGIPFIEDGDMGVDLFFILSGAVLYYVYANQFKNKRFSYKDFMWKRFARLYPTHLATMLASLFLISAATYFGLGEPPRYDLFKAVFAHLFLLQSLNILPTQSLNFPSWSISAEFFAYLLFPLLCAITLRLQAKTALALSALLLVFMAEILFPMPNFRTSSLYDLTYEYSVLRIFPEFLLGLCVARLGLENAADKAQSRFTYSALGIACLCLITYGLTGHPTPLVFGFAALIGGLMFLDIQVPAPLLYLGRISFAIYMVHILVWQVCRSLLVKMGYLSSHLPLWSLGPIILLVLLAGSLTYHWIEQPAQAWLLKWRKGMAGHASGSPTYR